VTFFPLLSSGKKVDHAAVVQVVHNLLPRFELAPGATTSQGPSSLGRETAKDRDTIERVVISFHVPVASSTVLVAYLRL